MNQVLLLPLLYKEITQLVGSRTGTQTQAIWLQSPHTLSHHAYLFKLIKKTLAIPIPSLGLHLKCKLEELA